MNAKHISIIVAVVALLTSCAKSPIEEVKPSEQLTDLELAYVGATETKAAIDGTDFPQTGEIGLFLFKDEAAGISYGGSGYTNVKYAYNSDKKKWTASPSIKVGSTPGYLYGYYPYTAGTQDKPVSIKAIPVTSTLNGDDVMYAEKVSNITDATASQTTITMNHALARIALTVTKSNYTGEAKLTNIKFTNAKGTADADKIKIASSGTLNAVNGTITADRAESLSFAVPEASQTISTDGSLYECLLVPSASVDTRQNVILTLSIDSDDKSIALSGDNGVIIKSSVKSTISITLSNTGLAVSSVSITDWASGTTHSGTIGGDI